MQDFNLSTVIYCTNNKNVEHTFRQANLSINNVNDFKHALICYYSTALQEIYDIDNARTHKTTCAIFNSYGNLKTTPCCS